MDEEVQMYLDDAGERMDQAYEHLQNELARIRAGKADPRILDGIKVDYYGVQTPLNQVSNINTPDSKTISIQPWEKTMIEPIEKAIMKANIGLTPINNGELIRINIPELTEERRKQLFKQVKHEGEQTKISIRNIRREIMDHLKKMKKDGLAEDLEKKAEEEMQKITDKHVEKVDKVMEKKEEDIMTV